MKIAIGTNYIKSYHRQDIAKESLLYLKRKFSNIDIFDIQFKEREDWYVETPGITTLYELARSSNNMCDGNKKLPFVNDMFKVLSQLKDYDYFIFANSDVILTDRLIEHIMNHSITAMPCSRIDIEDIQTLNDNIVPVRWEIAGFDVFVFKREWFLKHESKFKDYLFGRPYFDLAYASIMKIYGNNDLIGNKNPALCCHIHHGISSVTNENSEKEFNKKTYMENDQITSSILSYYIRNLLCRRTPNGRFLNEVANESEKEIEYFNQFKYECN